MGIRNIFCTVRATEITSEMGVARPTSDQPALRGFVRIIRAIITSEGRARSSRREWAMSRSPIVKTTVSISEAQRDPRSRHARQLGGPPGSILNWRSYGAEKDFRGFVTGRNARGAFRSGICHDGKSRVCNSELRGGRRKRSWAILAAGRANRFAACLSALGIYCLSDRRRISQWSRIDGARGHASSRRGRSGRYRGRHGMLVPTRHAALAGLRARRAGPVGRAN